MSMHERSWELQDTTRGSAHRDGAIWLPVETEVRADAQAGPDREDSAPLTGRMVSLAFIKDALRRGRRIWLAAAVLGLAIGAGYHVVVPLKYEATSTVFLVNPSGSGSTAMLTDVALLDAPVVAERAIALLGPQGRSVTSTALLGKDPGTVISMNLLSITVSGDSPQEAVLRVNAVAKAFLDYRAQQFEAQNAAEDAGDAAEISSLQREMTELTAEIATLNATHSSRGLAGLETQRASATTELSSLKGTVQQDNINTLSVTNGSRVITPGTPVATSRKKALALDGLTGLSAGLGAALLGILLFAVLSDRLRRREDVAAVLGAPVALSVGRVQRRILARPPLRMAAAPNHDLLVLVQYLRSCVLARSRRPTGSSEEGTLVVALDYVDVPAATLVALAKSLAREEKRVVLVDATRSRVLARALGPPERQAGRVDPRVTFVVASRPWEGEKGARWPHNNRDSHEEVSPLAAEHDAETLLVLATVEPDVGAWHLRRWGSEAIVIVTAGACSARRIAVATELLQAAGVAVVSAVLLNADATDESVGLPLANGHETHDVAQPRHGLVQST